MPSIVAFIFCLAFGSLIYQVNMAYLDMASFFNVTNNNLSSITWAHAVNSRSLLSAALNSNVTMLEADVVLGSLTGTNDTNTSIPIMAHPPANTSDLSLESFLNEVFTFNQNASTLVKKGVKLDFKTIDALESSTANISSIYSNMSYPVWINADIIEGPINATTVPVDPVRFFQSTKNFQNSTLSIGWTTRYGSEFNYTTYQAAHIDQMLAAIQNNNVNQTITFPVRAGIAAESLSEMQRLLVNVTGSTLTLWSSEGDPVNVTKLRNLVQTVGLNKTFIDVPEDLERKLNLSTLGAGSMILPITNLLATVLLVIYLL